MKDPKWMGTFPSNVHWDEHSEYMYFNYNPEGNPADSLYRIAVGKKAIEKVNWKAQKEQLPANGTYNATKTVKGFYAEKYFKNL